MYRALWLTCSVSNPSTLISMAYLTCEHVFMILLADFFSVSRTNLGAEYDKFMYTTSICTVAAVRLHLYVHFKTGDGLV